MGKALKTAGAIIGGAVLIATGVGALAGLNVAAMGIASFTGSMTIGQLGMLSAGVSAVGGMLDKPKSGGAAAPTDWTANPDQPTPFAFGRVGAAGKIVHRDEYGKDSKLQSIVSVFSGAGPIKGFVSFKAGDLPVTFVSNGGTAIGKYDRQMWRSWRLGAQPDTALSLPTGLDDGAVMPGWGAAYKLSGKACDLWTLQQDSKLSVYPGNAEPKPLTVFDGIYGYDHRFDSTYPGGFGDCRLNDRTTWRWIEDPIIAALNWALGMKENGQVVGGIGASPGGIDFAAFGECANISEANGWKVSAWPDTSEDASVILDQLLQAGGAVRARHAGKISCVSRGAPRASVVTITRRDTAGAIELDTGASLFNRINTITPRFMSEASGWKLATANPVTFEALRTEDGGRRGDQIDYRFVPAIKQAAELAAYDILDAREPFAGTIPLKPHMRQLKRGDCFDIDEPGFLLDGVKCLVLSRSYDPSKGEVRIAFRSETDGKHDLALGKTTTLPDYPELTPADPTFVSPPQVGDWTIVPRPPGADDVQVPIVDLVGAVSNATATGMLVEWAYPGDPLDWQVAGTWPVTAEKIPLNGLQPDAAYYLGLTYVRGQNHSERVISGPHTAPGLVAGDTVNVGGHPVDQLAEYFRELPDLIHERDRTAEVLIREALDRRDRIVAEERSRIDGDLAEAVARAAGLMAEAAARGAAIAGVESSVSTVASDLAAEIVTRTAQYAATVAAVALVASSVTTVANDLAAETATRTTQISTINGTLAAHTASIDTNATAISAETTARTAAIATINGTLASHATSISANATAISAETSARTTAISTVNASIAAVAADVSTNATAIAAETSTRTAQISTINGTLASHTTDIATNASAIAAETSTRTSQISTINGTLAAHTTDISTNATSISAAVTRVSSLEATVDTPGSGLTARTGSLETAVVILETGYELARFQFSASTSGGAAILSLASDTYGTIAGLLADRIYFGENTFFDDATKTLRTVVGSNTRYIALGSPIGTTSDILEWFGPTSVAFASLTKFNALEARTTAGRTYQGGVLQTMNYGETATGGPVTINSTGFTDVLTLTLGRSVGLTDTFQIAGNLNITLSPRTRSSSTSEAPSGEWQIWELPASGTTNERQVAQGSWATTIVGAGGNPEYITDINMGFAGDNWSDTSRPWRFRHGGLERFVLKMKKLTSANMVDVNLGMLASIIKYD